MNPAIKLFPREVRTHSIMLNDDQIHELRIGLSMRRESLKRRMRMFTAAHEIEASGKQLKELDAINNLLSL